MSGERHLYTIPAEAPFLRNLGRELMEREDFERTLILLPTRRACRSLRETFLDLKGGQPVLLPRMQPLGDVDQDELDLHLAGLYGVSDLPDIPPAMPLLKRLMLLGRLIGARDSSLGSEQILRLAESLATLIDQVHTENLDFADLPGLVPPGDLSDHWKLTLEFLSIVTESWPFILEQEGEIDPADRRNRLMQTLAAAWRDQPPSFPVIAAGSTGSIPATASLLDAVSLLPRGAVVLPGLDLGLDADSWDSFTDTHPQATLRNLLSRFGVERDAVRLWPCREMSPPARASLAREIMRPAASVQTWTHLKRDPPALAALQASLDGLHLVEAATLSDEAQIIAVVMREALEQPGRTAELVTPDRELARRVSSTLRKWDVTVDDSAGCPLDALPAGSFLETVLVCVRDSFSPLSLLNLLKHVRYRLLPEAGVLTEFELKLCRGPRPESGFSGLKGRLAALPVPSPALSSLLERLEAAFATLRRLAPASHPAAAFVSALITVSEALAGGADGMWAGEDGDAASGLLSGLNDQAHSIPASDLKSFHGMLRHLLQGVTVRPQRRSHPRLAILGQLEARMIRSDVLIMSGLNEGVWPAEARHDPWMSRPMRARFGLPSPERGIGLSAHDFAQGLCCDKVVLTRSLKTDGAPTVPSRWLQRLSTLLDAAGIPFASDRVYPRWAQSLQYSARPALPAEPPEPRPPPEARPAQVSATWIERWMRNPYHIYVRKILRLKPLDPVDQDLTAAERGSFVHKVLEEFVRECRDSLPADAKDVFLRIARAEAGAHRTDSAEWRFWWPRLERLAETFIAYESEWRQRAAPWLLEVDGAFTFLTPRGGFTLTARADRIDRLKDGGAAIVDYKTGNPPSKTSVLKGDSPQLPLEGLVLRHGGYGEPAEARLLAHWKISGSAGDRKRSEIEADDTLITATETFLKNLVLQYEQPDTPYSAQPPGGKRLYDEDRAIHHLARTAEWSSSSGPDEEDAA